MQWYVNRLCKYSLCWIFSLIWSRQGTKNVYEKRGKVYYFRPQIFLVWEMLKLNKRIKCLSTQVASSHKYTKTIHIFKQDFEFTVNVRLAGTCRGKIWLRDYLSFQFEHVTVLTSYPIMPGPKVKKISGCKKKCFEIFGAVVLEMFPGQWECHESIESKAVAAVSKKCAKAQGNWKKEMTGKERVFGIWAKLFQRQAKKSFKLVKVTLRLFPSLSFFEFWSKFSHNFGEYAF